MTSPRLTPRSAVCSQPAPGRFPNPRLRRLTSSEEPSVKYLLLIALIVVVVIFLLPKLRGGRRP